MYELDIISADILQENTTQVVVWSWVQMQFTKG
jgi:hypothetical protein